VKVRQTLALLTLCFWLFLSVPAGIAGTPVTGTARGVAAEQDPPKKVVIFYSSIGKGHEESAKSIEKRIKERNSSVLVTLKDIRDFAPKLQDKIEEKIYWTLVKNFPNTFDAMYRGAMARGNLASSMDQVTQSYNPQKILKFIKNRRADVIIATQ